MTHHLPIDTNIKKQLIKLKLLLDFQILGLINTEELQFGLFLPAKVQIPN